MKEEDPLKDLKPVVSSLPGEVPPVAVEKEIPTDAEPTPPEAQGGLTLKDVIEAILKRQDETDKKLDSLGFNMDADHGKLLKHDEILQKVDSALDKLLPIVQAVNSPQMPTTASGGFSIGGVSIKDIMEMAKSAGLVGGGPSDPMGALYRQIGEKVMSGTIDSTVKRITKQLGGETASHVVVDSGHG